MHEPGAEERYDYPGGASVEGRIGDLSGSPTMITLTIPVEGFPDGLTLSWTLSSDKRRIFRELAGALRQAAETVEREAEQPGPELEPFHAAVPPSPIRPAIEPPPPSPPTAQVALPPVLPMPPPNNRPSAPHPGPTRWVSLGQLLQDQADVREAVWRYLLQGEISGPVFLSAPGFTPGSEPDDELLGRFLHGRGVPHDRRTGQPIRVLPFSRAIITPDGVRDSENGELGVLLYADAATWESESIAIVQGGYFVNEQSAGDFQFRLRGSGNPLRRAGTSDTWVIVEAQPFERPMGDSAPPETEER